MSTYTDMMAKYGKRKRTDDAKQTTSVGSSYFESVMAKYGKRRNEPVEQGNWQYGGSSLNLSDENSPAAPAQTTQRKPIEGWQRPREDYYQTQPADIGNAPIFDPEAYFRNSKDKKAALRSIIEAASSSGYNVDDLPFVKEARAKAFSDATKWTGARSDLLDGGSTQTGKTRASETVKDDIQPLRTNAGVDVIDRQMNAINMAAPGYAQSGRTLLAPGEKAGFMSRDYTADAQKRIKENNKTLARLYKWRNAPYKEHDLEDQIAALEEENKSLGNQLWLHAANDAVYWYKREKVTKKPAAYTKDNLPENAARILFLAEKPSLTAAEREEAKEIIRNTEFSIGGIPKDLADALIKAGSQEPYVAMQVLAEKTKDSVFAAGGRGVGIGLGLQDAADAATSLGRRFLHGASSELGLDYSERLWRNQTNELQSLHPVASTVGNVAGNVAKHLLLKELAGAVIGAASGTTASAGVGASNALRLTGSTAQNIPRFFADPYVARLATTSLTFGLSSAVSNIGEVASNKMSAGEYAGGVAVSSLAGLIGGVASELVNHGITKALIADPKKQTAFFEFVRNAAAASAFSVANQGTEIAYDAIRGEKIDKKQVAMNLVSSFAFAMISSAFSSIKATKEAKSTLLKQYDELKKFDAEIREIDESLQGNEQYYAPGSEAAQQLAARRTVILGQAYQTMNSIRQAIATTYYAGQADLLKDVNEYLDVLSDAYESAAIGAYHYGTGDYADIPFVGDEAANSPNKDFSDALQIVVAQGVADGADIPSNPTAPVAPISPVSPATPVPPSLQFPASEATPQQAQSESAAGYRFPQESSLPVIPEDFVSMGVNTVPASAQEAPTAAPSHTPATEQTVSEPRETAPEAPTRTTPQQTVSVPVMQAINQVMDGERVTNRVADEILQDEEAVAYLQSETGLEITSGMTNSQKLEAVRTAVNSLVGTMDITAQENGTQPTQETPAAQENRTPAQEVADIGQTLNLGTNGMTALTEQYDGESDPMEYAKAMTVVYNAGSAVASGETYNEAAVQEAFGKLTEEQQTAAWKAGINDAKEALATEAGAEYDNNINNEVTEGTTYGQGDTGYREGRVRSQRNYAAQQGEEVAGGAAQTGSVNDQGGVGSGARQENARDSWSPRNGKTPEARNLVYGREVTDSELGVKTDPSAPKVRAVTSGETSAMKRANATMHRVGKLIGAKVRSLFFGGSNLSIVEDDGSISRGVEAFSQAWRNFVALPADHPGITVDRFAGHEWMEELLSHGVVKLNEVVDAVRDAVGDEVFDAAIEIYKDIYRSNDVTRWTKEFICDGAGNINRQSAYYDISKNPERKAAAQLLDVVLETIHNHLNEITDGAFSDVPPLESQMTDETDVPFVSEETKQTIEDVGAQIDTKSESAAPTDNKTQYSTSPVSDEDYLAAVENEEYRVAHDMVLDAIKRNMANTKVRDKSGNLLRMYHGTNAIFTEFDRAMIGSTGRFEGSGFNFTPYEGRAKSYGGTVLAGYLNIQNPLNAEKKTFSVKALADIIKSADPTGDNIIANYADDTRDYGSLSFIRREALTTARKIWDYSDNDVEIYSELSTANPDAEGLISEFEKMGYDGAIHYDVDGEIKTAIAFSSSQFKLDDPVTYDADGNPIPLSERINTSVGSINYSVAPPATERTVDSVLARKLEQARKRAAYWKGQTKTTTKALTKVAQDAISTYNSTVKASDLLTRLQSLARNIFRAGDAAVDYEAIQTEARDIARDIVNGAEILQDESKDFAAIREQLDGTRITISREDAAQIDNYLEFRRHLPKYFHISTESKSSKGGVTTNVGTLYDSLRGEFPALFPDINGAGAQLQQIADVMQNLDTIITNPYSDTMAEAIQWCANGIIDAITGESIVPTAADKQEARYQEMRQRGKNALAEAKKAGAEKLAAERQKGKEALDSLRKASQERLGAALKEKQEDTQKRLADLRADRDKKLADLKQHYRDVAAAKRERKTVSEIGTRLLKIMRRLKAMKMSTANAAVRDELIGEFDLVAKSLTNGKAEDLNRLRGWYDEQKKNNHDFISNPYVEDAISRLSQKHISDLTVAEMIDLTNVLLNFEHNIREGNKFINSVLGMEIYGAGVQTIRDIENSKGSKGGVIYRLETLNLLSPERAMHRFTGYAENDPLYIATQELGKGGIKQLDYQRRAYDIFKRYLDDTAFMDSISGKKARWETIKVMQTDGSEVTISLTPAMRISLYLSSLNDNNLLHIRNGGVTIPDKALYLKGKLSDAMAQGTRVKLEPSTVRQIASSMTEKERAFARAAWRYFNEFSSPEISAVSEAKDGFARPMVDNYFPIDTNQNFLSKEFDTIKRDGSMDGVGWLQERVAGADNPIYLYDADFVVKKAIDAHSKYVGYAIPVQNFGKLWGVTTGYWNDKGKYVGYTNSVQAAMQKKWGKSAVDYVENMMEAISFTGMAPDSIGEVLRKARSAYAGAVLTFSPGTAIMQTTSYPTAAYILGAKPLIKALSVKNKKVDLKLIQKYTPLLWYRGQGYIDADFGDLTRSGKTSSWATNMIQAMDVFTTTKLWTASEYYVQDHNKDLAVGTDEYYRAVADVYNRVIRETQPNYTPMERPQVLKSKNDLTRSLVMFATQRFQNFNILYDALGKMQAEKTRWKNTGDESAKQAYKEASKSAARAIWSQLSASFAFAVVTALRDLFRGRTRKYKDKDGNANFWTIAGGLGRNMLANGFGMFILGSEAVTIAEGLINSLAKGFRGEKLLDTNFYGFEVSVFENLTNIANDSFKLAEQLGAAASALANGEDVDVETLFRTAAKAAGDVGSITGVPIANIRRVLEVVGRLGLKGVGAVSGNKHLFDYYALRITSDPDKNKTEYYDLLYKAYKSGAEDYHALYDLMLKDGFTESGANGSYGGIRAAMEKRMKEERGVESVKDLPNRYKAP